MIRLRWHHILFTLVLTIGLSNTARATVRPAVDVSIEGEFDSPAAGETHEGVLVFRLGEAGKLDQITMAGSGWRDENLDVPVIAASKAGDLVRVPFRAKAVDVQQPLIVSFEFNGEHDSREIDLSPTAARRSKGNVGGVRRMPGATGPSFQGPTKDMPRPQASKATPYDKVPMTEGLSDASAEHDATHKARNIRVRGRWAYALNGGAIIGGDGVTVRVYDEDTFGDELLATVVTDAFGNFDTTFNWDPCAVFCDGQPDIYVLFEMSNSEFTVKTTGGNTYRWQTGTTNDYLGTDMNLGTLFPGSEADDPSVHLLTTMTRTWRWFIGYGDDASHIDVFWPNGTTGAWYNGSVNIGQSQSWNEATHTHEYGHHWVNEFSDDVPPAYCNGLCDTNGCGHCLWCEETANVAWSEGLPDWMGGEIPGTWTATYGVPVTSIYALETTLNCPVAGRDDPLMTEAYLAALMTDMSDAAQDNDPSFNSWSDRLSGLQSLILNVARIDQPLTASEFLFDFKARYPGHKENFWETCKNNGYEIDTANPAVATGLTSTSHTTSGDSPDNTIDFVWNRASDDASGVDGYGIFITGSQSLPSAIKDIEDVTSYTTPALSPGIYYFNLRTVDRSGKWSSSYVSYGPITIRAAEPANLEYFLATGWDEWIVPRPTNDATSGNTAAPTTLTGNANSTYLNIRGLNSGESTTSSGWEFRLHVDDVWRYSLFYGPIAAGGHFIANNFGPVSVIGGRHTYEGRLDAIEQIPETNEADNRWGKQWIWSPLDLAVATPVNRSAPPNATGGWASASGTLWFNCDGLRMDSSGGWWNAAVIRANSNSDDYDARLHTASTGATDGFGSNRGYSSRAAGCLDAVLVNSNVEGFTSFDVGVLNVSGSGAYTAEHVISSSYTYGDSTTISMANDEMLMIREFYVDTPDVGAVSLVADIDPADGPIHMVWLASDFGAGDLLDGDASTTSDVNGRARLDVNIAAAGYNAVVIYRDPKDGTGALDVTLEIGATPPDMTPNYTAAGWHGPLVPRPAFDGTVGSTPVPATLTGNSTSTYVNLTVQNDSPSGATAFPIHGFIDGVFAWWVAWGAVPPNWTGYFNWDLPFHVRGGRHTFSMRTDPTEEHEEIYETNNITGEQWVWSPLQLAMDTPVSRMQPPDQVGGWEDVDHPVGAANWYNCDGLRTPVFANVSSDGYWGAIAVMPEAGSDVDVRIHDVVAGTKNGFAGNLGRSSWGPEQSDYMLVNFNQVGFSAFDAGVLDASGSAGFSAEAVQSTFLATATGTHGEYDLPPGAMLDIYEVWLEPGVHIIQLENRDRELTSDPSQQVDFGLTLHPGDEPYMSKSNVVASSWFAPEGQDEWLTVDIADANYYGIAVWKARTADLDRHGRYNIVFSGSGVTDVGDDLLPQKTAIASVYPNPFNPRTQVSFELNQTGEVSVSVFNLRGERVRTLVQASLNAGRHEVVWDGTDDRGQSVASGTYLLSMEAGDFRDRRKLVLVK